jgi:hypothetical protein
MIVVGRRWTRLSRVTCFGRFHPHAGYLILTSIMNGRINSDQEGTKIMANGWIRCTSFPCPLSVVDTENDRIRSAAVVNEYRRQIYNPDDSSWLSQANDIFNRLEITRGFENFGIFSVSRGSNCSAHFPQLWPMASTIAFSFLEQQIIIFRLPVFVPLGRAPNRRPDMLSNSGPTSLLVPRPIGS